MTQQESAAEVFERMAEDQDIQAKIDEATKLLEAVTTGVASNIEETAMHLNYMLSVIGIYKERIKSLSRQLYDLSVQLNHEGGNMNFGLALESLKSGAKVYREGWNGKGMFLRLIPAGGYSILSSITEGHIHPLLPFIGMKTADNCFVPWLASQTDVLAEDWCVDPIVNQAETQICPGCGEDGMDVTEGIYGCAECGFTPEIEPHH